MSTLLAVTSFLPHLFQLLNRLHLCYNFCLLQTHDNISFTHHSDLITLDSSNMTYLLCSQSAQLRTFSGSLSPFQSRPHTISTVNKTQASLLNIFPPLSPSSSPPLTPSMSMALDCHQQQPTQALHFNNSPPSISTQPSSPSTTWQAATLSPTAVLLTAICNPLITQALNVHLSSLIVPLTVYYALILIEHSYCLFDYFTIYQHSGPLAADTHLCSRLCPLCQFEVWKVPLPCCSFDTPALSCPTSLLCPLLCCVPLSMICRLVCMVPSYPPLPSTLGLAWFMACIHSMQKPPCLGTSALQDTHLCHFCFELTWNIFWQADSLTWNLKTL